MKHFALIALAVAACGNSHATTPDATSSASDGASTSDAVTTCATTELCDGVVDDNCDGHVDEGCGRCPLLAVTCPTGCCPVPSWEIEQSSTTGASVAVDDAGNIYVLYTVKSGGPWHAMLATYDAVPGTWSKRDIGVGATYRNRIILDHQGRLHLLRGGSEGILHYERSDDRGQTFAVESMVAPLPTGEVFDLAVDSAGNPHVVWTASQLMYATYDGTWHVQTVDPNPGYGSSTLAVGFADRPHIVVELQGAPVSKLHVFFDGNQWRSETIDVQSGGTTFNGGDHFFTEQALAIAADESLTVTYTKETAQVQSLIVATRPPGVVAPWTLATVPGVTSFDNASLLTDPAGGLLAVTDGIALQRGSEWQTIPTGIAGDHVASFRRGNHVYMVFNTNTTSGLDSLQITVVSL